MKKVIALIAIIAVGFIGFKGFQYYDNTYKSTTAYALVPETVPEKTETVDSNGKKITEDGKQSYSYDYQFEFITANGKKESLGYELAGVDPETYEPGTYITAEVSKTRIVRGPFKIAQEDVPQDILAKLKQ